MLVYVTVFWAGSVFQKGRKLLKENYFRPCCDFDSVWINVKIESVHLPVTMIFPYNIQPIVLEILLWWADREADGQTEALVTEVEHLYCAYMLRERKIFWHCTVNHSYLFRLLTKRLPPEQITKCWVILTWISCTSLLLFQLQVYYYPSIVYSN